MATALKEIYNEQYIKLLSSYIVLEYKDFDVASFTLAVFEPKWSFKSLKERMRHISTTLHTFLPFSYKQSLEILQNVFLQMNEKKFALANMIFQDFVEVYGIQYFQISIEALRIFTVHSSSEFAVRVFILHYEDEMMQVLQEWAKDENEEIRRLASEGCRPRLPWAIALPRFQKDPSKILPILEILKQDPSLYVRKSVANNLNDISKDNPHIVKEIIRKWYGQNEKTDWILKHGARTLLKAGEREVLDMFGFVLRDDIILTAFSLPKSVMMGETLEFSFTLSSVKPLGKLRIEYKIDFKRQNKRYLSKVFQISQGIYKEREKSFFKSYSFAKITTRKYYEGKHFLTLICNGVVLEKREFFLYKS
ncbi:DNA alkylation repair enzyme [hydrothermal vent metagenome]|uniref:DNA alkylation repair enzyme n=1 Tax=hydrothermal vent metagenome TaxID=652676 RepID=A0A1W1D2B0_9ZZZZ